MKLSLVLDSALLGLLALRVNSFSVLWRPSVPNYAHPLCVRATSPVFGQPSPRCSFNYRRNSANALRAGGARGRRLNDLTMSTVVIPSDFKLPIGISALGLAVSGLGNLTGGCILSALGLGLAVQATRVSIEFDDEAMEVKIGDDKGELVSSGENAFVGGESRWSYKTWTNWEVYPSEKFPILLYFKETQTTPEGQIHFFPFIMKADILLSQIRMRVPQVAK